MTLWLPPFLKLAMSGAGRTYDLGLNVGSKVLKRLRSARIKIAVSLHVPGCYGAVPLVWGAGIAGTSQCPRGVPVLSVAAVGGWAANESGSCRKRSFSGGPRQRVGVCLGFQELDFCR